MPEPVFKEGKDVLIGHLETDSGMVLLTDGIWASELPNTTQSRICLDLDLPRMRIPVYATFKNGKRYLIIDIDSAKPASKTAPAIVTVEEPGPEPSPDIILENPEQPA